MKEETGDVLRLVAPNEACFDEEGNTLVTEQIPRQRPFFGEKRNGRSLRRTLFGLKLNFLIPSSSVVFLNFAFSNRLGSSEGTTSGVFVPLKLLLSEVKKGG
jgi:hypothetical protein